MSRSKKKLVTIRLKSKERVMLKKFVNKGSAKAREIKRANILLLSDKDMKMQNFFKTIFILIRLKILFITFLSSSLVSANIQTEWNITFEKETPVPSNRYKSCQNPEAEYRKNKRYFLCRGYYLMH